MSASTLPQPAQAAAKPSPLAAWIFSSIGKKSIVALTGIILVLFVIGHLCGNLTIFFGRDVMNAYAMHLRDLGPFLWVIRLGLLAAVALHIYFTMLLWKENLAARPKKYERSNRIQSTLFARTMRLTGLIVLAFVVFHLAHFTLQIVDPSYRSLHAELDGRQVHDVYGMAVKGFSNPLVSVIYVAALALLALHLSHGIASLFQTLGLTNQKLRHGWETGGVVLAWALFLGYVSIPIYVLAGAIK